MSIYLSSVRVSVLSFVVTTVSSVVFLLLSFSKDGSLSGNEVSIPTATFMSCYLRNKTYVP